MSDTLSAVLAQAMQLSEAEQCELIDRLVDSIDPPNGLYETAEDEFATELHRRDAELATDPTAGLSWDQLKDMR